MVCVENFVEKFSYDEYEELQGTSVWYSEWEILKYMAVTRGMM